MGISWTGIACANADVVENPEKNTITHRGGTGRDAGRGGHHIVSTNVIAGIVPNMDLANSTAPFGLALPRCSRLR
ncbi:hypothetical protein KCP69_21105 [Salmonella enterica subsp. enterica]|nr:hypothetical protein KCP69_21105 [Salmonella enterica subsp. enterica]